MTEDNKILIDYLKDLLPLLKSNNVVEFRSGNSYIKFNTNQEIQPQVEAKVDESQLPVDLRSDNINSIDTITNWSAEPSHNEPEMPGTGDNELKL